MADTFTVPMTQTGVQLDQPETGASTGSWGSKLNTVLSQIVAEVNAISALLATAITTANAALARAGGVMTGRVDAFATRRKVTALGNISGPQNLDLSLSDNFSATLTGNVTFSFVNVPSAGSYALTVYVYLQGSSSFTITWPTSVNWAFNGTPPVFSPGFTRMLLRLDSFDGGTTWLGQFPSLNP